MNTVELDETRVGIAVAAKGTPQERAQYYDRTLVAGLVRDALVQGGLGKRDPSAPFIDIIEPGMTVLLKPNWVLHYNKSNMGMACMITHPVFVEAVLTEVLKARPGRVIIGDAPIQSAIFEQLAPAAWVRHLQELAHPCAVDVIDFRKSICDRGRWTLKVGASGRAPGSYILFDLADKSLLEPLSASADKFRNTSYDHTRLVRTHCAGRHQYLLSREVFDSDIVINLPKLKSHRKAGLTAALKNIVGLNGDKDYLPHHRVGGSAQGGDCYDGNRPLKRIAEYFGDRANRHINQPGFLLWQRFSSLFLRLNGVLHHECELEGSWYGNDTIWRMILDLNRILLYGRADGTLAPSPERKILSLTDAITAGEGLGPLAPEPVDLRAVTFASSSAFADYVHAALMHFDGRKIPSINNAFGKFDYPLVNHAPSEVGIFAAGRRLSLEEAAAAFGHPFKPAPGWQGHIERTADH